MKGKIINTLVFFSMCGMYGLLILCAIVFLQGDVFCVLGHNRKSLQFRFGSVRLDILKLSSRFERLV
jgi:hypothetical protein